ncbi:bifunctional 2-polyprenyl-6-hydroxyphenol methylase/3-demethylubiquinol 3-O-methyltransferase UbiG [uncultured Psychroserpens sp.]|uniref:class I SAM-dependent methyltransferase n=1 Tax=uncultured Psychroserpens sp. TaxID=255436 RepID=UPI00262FD37F|nr:class I SAM-dependent methyltransferase [uncultured Psychroserpens sp.]
MKTWEETIQYIRKKPEFEALVEQAYFHEDLVFNVENFGKSDEFFETLRIIKSYQPKGKRILDIGCGNGISSINFALNNYHVTAVEPDTSNTVGSGAIRILKKNYKLNNIEIHEDFAENIKFDSNSFDIVYIRQAMHHANDIEKFIKECVRVLKPKGLLLCVRDHVIYNQKDKDWFLKEHPLHKFYGGENAFTSEIYKNAIELAGAEVKKELKYYDSVINYFPTKKEDLQRLAQQNTYSQKKKLAHKIGVFAKIPLVWLLYKKFSSFESLNEKHIPGRMYSYISIKK